MAGPVAPLGEIRHRRAGEYVVVPMCAAPRGPTVESVPFPRLSEVLMKSFLAACASICALAFAVPAMGMPADTQPTGGTPGCQPASASAPWALTFCNPGGHSRGVGAGVGRF
jgi:hypothetical protein